MMPYGNARRIKHIIISVSKSRINQRLVTHCITVVIIIRKVFARILTKIFQVYRWSASVNFQALLKIWKALRWSLDASAIGSTFLRHVCAFVLLFPLHLMVSWLGTLIYKYIRRLYYKIAIALGSTYYLRHRQLTHELRNASTFEEWERNAIELDNMEGKLAWQRDQRSAHYDFRRVANNVKIMRHLIKNHSINHDPQALIRYLRSRLLRNLGCMGDSKLFQHSRVGSKHLIDEYRHLVMKALNTVYVDQNMPLTTKLAFFRETRHSYGRTALLLSGGAGTGLYHLGVISGLQELGCLPNIISGSSCGAIFVGMLATRTNTEMEEMYRDSDFQINFFSNMKGASMLEALRRFLNTHALIDSEHFTNCIRQLVGEVTFQEAFDRTGRIASISVTPTSAHVDPMLLNYLTAPHVLIWSAIVASCAVPGLYPSVQLMSKNSLGEIVPYYTDGMTFVDGSVKLDLPMARLSELFNVNHTIVSQTNPHVLPFLFSSHQDEYALALGILPRILRFLGKECNSLLVNLMSLVGLDSLEISHWPIVGHLQLLSLLCTQVYAGDITMVPQLSLGDYLELVKNPTPARISECYEIGRRYTWRHASQIRSHCEIEFCLDELLHKVRGELIFASLTTPQSLEEEMEDDSLNENCNLQYTSRKLKPLQALHGFSESDIAKVSANFVYFPEVTPSSVALSTSCNGKEGMDSRSPSMSADSVTLPSPLLTLPTIRDNSTRSSKFLCSPSPTIFEHSPDRENGIVLNTDKTSSDDISELRSSSNAGRTLPIQELGLTSRTRSFSSFEFLPQSHPHYRERYIPSPSSYTVVPPFYATPDIKASSPKEWMKFVENDMKNAAAQQDQKLASPFPVNSTSVFLSGQLNSLQEHIDRIEKNVPEV